MWRKKASNNVSNEEIITNFVEATKGIKNLKLENEYSITENQSKNELMKVNSESLVIKEPFAAKIDLSMMGITSIIYIKDGNGYMLEPFTNKWEKEKVGTGEVDILYSLYLPIADEFYDALKANIDKVNIEKKGENYIITTTDVEFFEAAIKEQYNLMFFAISKVNNFAFEYVVDGKTLLPVAFNFTVDFSNDENDNKVVSMTSKYSEINEIKDIELPDEAKNAQGVKK